MRLNLGEQAAPVEPIAEGDPLPPHDVSVPSAAVTLDLLYRAHRPKLLRFARRRTRGELAPDIIQQLFLRLAARASGAIATIAAPDAYLQRAARNLIRDEARAADRRSAHLHLCADDLPLVAPDQIAALEARDMLRRLESIVAHLHPRTREIFLAHRIDGFSYAEIASRMGLSIKTVEKHMSRAIAYLGRHLSE
ncbi:RNA polymerase sigma factor [Sphingomonas sp. ERG5]|uniref:RNA polymerase sigma factor n=1 Tax=Sphingomonas sp. ERG5 TaxID=1381597 RepID=UPI00054C08E3|nr:sigma-70 family RNA polymerase sigma factor [Sphingomonas sp. ERG5]